MKPKPNGSKGGRWLTARQFYALIWKDFVVHKRHYIWTMLEIIIPVLVCALAILSNTHQGKPKLENERTFDPDDFERIYGELTPQRHKLLVAPNSSFTRALIDQIDDGAVSIELVDNELELENLIKKEIPVSLDQVKRLLPDDSANVTIGGVVILSDSTISLSTSQNSNIINNQPKKQSKPDTTTIKQRQIKKLDDSYYYEVISKLDGLPMKIPINFDMSIRAKDFRLGPEPFPKKFSLGPYLHGDHYLATSFMASQIMLSRAYINLLAQYMNNSTTISTSTSNSTSTSTSSSTSSSSSSSSNVLLTVPTNDDIIGQRMPYPKYVAHKRLKETTLGTFVAGSQKQKPFVLTMDFCITIGFLVTAIFLAKRIVDEKKSKVRNMLRLVGISDWTYYGSHMSNTMIIMLIQCFMITFLFTGHHDAPAQNINSLLLFTILILYCISAVMFVLTLSTLFNSSTKAIIFTALLWLALPEIIDRIFKMNSGVIESNGSIAVHEYFHLSFCLLPNFGLKLINRLLTECDIYGEFYNKKELYGEYRAIWENIFNVLPLYKVITVGHIMLTMFASNFLYIILIYFINLSASASESLTNFGSTNNEDPKSNLKFKNCFPLNLIVFLIKLIITLISAPLKIIHCILVSNSYSSTTNLTTQLSSKRHNQIKKGNKNHNGPSAGYLNSAYASSVNNIDADPAGKISLELSSFAMANAKDSNKLQQLNCVDLNNSNDQDRLNYDQNNDQRYFERAPAMLSTGVSIRNLCKTYFPSGSAIRRIDAVKKVSLDMFYSQILVLLGHNGAGKTTLIDIISGHNNKTSGQVFIDGFDIDTHPAEARRQVGFCPQFDVLFERLTVEEHLYFYGIVKGARQELGDEIEELLLQSGLDVHRKKLSKALSGGYKRKLSLAIAMIAKSKVLILDEPTSGMDPESRRKVWDFLQLIRHDRLILMTTHHMEEADALGDRIAVMSSGQVKCCGSALFLKRCFNAGYHLRISKSASWNQIAFDELIGERFNLRHKLENLTPHELMYKFDADETGNLLPKLFDELEKNKERIGIFGFGITVSTMDDVFMKIGLHFKDVEAEEMQSKFELANGLTNNLNGSSSSISKNSTVDIINLNNENRSIASALASCRKERLQGGDLFKQHLRALLAKRYQHARKNWFQLVWILSISLACVASIVILIDFVIFKEELTPEWEREMTLEGAGYGSETTGVFQFAPPPAEAAAAAADELETLRDKAFPALSETTTTTPSTSSAIAEAAAAAAAASTTTLGPPSSSVSQRRRRRRSRRQIIDGQAIGSNDSALFLQKYWLNQAHRSGMNELITYTDINTQMIDLITKKFADFREHYVIGGEKAGKKYIAWYSGEATHSFPISMNIMLNSILKQFTDLIQDNGHPLKGSRISLRHNAMAQINTLIAFLPHLGRLINLFFLPFSLAFITSYFVIFPTHERVTKSKHLQLMTGVPARTFWLSHFLFDLLLYSAYTVLMLTVYFVWDRVINDRKIYFANYDHSVALIALVSLFIFGALPLAYIFSFLAKKPTSAFSSFCVLTILTGTATLTLVSLYELKYEHSASPTFKFLFMLFLWTARLIPSVSLLVGLQKLFALNTTRSICINVAPEVLDLLCRYINSPIVDDELKVLRPERCCKSVCQDECFDQWPFFWTGWFGINIELTMLVFDAALFWFILVLIESRSLRNNLRTLLSCFLPSCLINSFTESSKTQNYYSQEETMSSSYIGSENSREFRQQLKRKSAGAFLNKWARSWHVPQMASLNSSNNFNENNATDQDRERLERESCSEIRQEKGRVQSIVKNRQFSNYSMVVDKLTKIYSENKHKAVDELSFVVDKREFFGLLGVNGAGKSTTFKMLTGELRATSGNSAIGSHDIKSERRLYLKQIGYCPQQDALIDNMTGNEMLTLFARLRGIPEQYISGAVEDTIEKLGLKKIASIDCNNYSGGNKRRLSVGMALIGAPEVIFLDEPTSGVDPRSRRRLWSTLIEFQQLTKSAIVMTSHSMNECECLCDRVAIMVGGKFKVLGSIQYLRTKLSQGFSLVLKLKPDNLKNLKDLTKSSEIINSYMKEKFKTSEIKLKDLHQTIIQYHIEPSKELTWSKMLLILEKAKLELQLEDYQITSDASLESIFLSLANNDNKIDQHQNTKTNSNSTNKDQYNISIIGHQDQNQNQNQNKKPQNQLASQATTSSLSQTSMSSSLSASSSSSSPSTSERMV